MLDKFHQTLASHGRSVTRSRTLLFEYLTQHDAVPLQQFVAENKKIADQASLYRTLQLFRELGVIEERFGRGEKLLELSDSYDAHHHHLTCQSCGKVIPVEENPEIEQLIKTLAKQNSFLDLSHQLEIRGICQDCSQSQM